MVRDLKVGIIGSRSFNNYRLLKEVIFENEETKISRNRIRYLISGGAVGADSLGQQFAKEFGLPILIFYPDWNSLGKSAGFIRNESIIKACNLIYAFQVDDSKGTQNSIDLAKKYTKKLHVIKL
jgi:hypothetical protein